jgi:hypothetical protein
VASAKIRGRVIDQTGAPVPSAEIWLIVPRPVQGDPYLDYGDQSRVVADVQSDAEGRFHMGPVGTGEYWIGLAPLSRTGNPSQPQDISTFAQRLRVSNESAELEYDLLVYRSVYVRGTVVTPRGDPEPSAVVKAFLPSDVELLSVVAEADGKFAVGPLTPATYRVQASSTHRYIESESIAVAGGDSGIVLPLKQGGVIVGFLVDKESRRPTVATVFLSPHGEDREILFTDVDYFRIAGIEPGLYDLTAKSNDDRIGYVRALRVELGDDAPSTVLELAPGADLKVNNEAGSGVDSCRFFADGVCVASAYLGGYEKVSRVVPEGRIEVRYWKGGRLQTVSVDAWSDGKPQVTIR